MNLSNGKVCAICVLSMLSIAITIFAYSTQNKWLDICVILIAFSILGTLTVFEGWKVIKNVTYTTHMLQKAGNDPSMIVFTPLRSISGSSSKKSNRIAPDDHFGKITSAPSPSALLSTQPPSPIDSQPVEIQTDLQTPSHKPSTNLSEFALSVHTLLSPLNQKPSTSPQRNIERHSKRHKLSLVADYHVDYADEDSDEDKDSRNDDTENERITKEIVDTLSKPQQTKESLTHECKLEAKGVGNIKRTYKSEKHYQLGGYLGSRSTAQLSKHADLPIDIDEETELDSVPTTDQLPKRLYRLNSLAVNTLSGNGSSIHREGMFPRILPRLTSISIVNPMPRSRSIFVPSSSHATHAKQETQLQNLSTAQADSVTASSSIHRSQSIFLPKLDHYALQRDRVEPLKNSFLKSNLEPICSKPREASNDFQSLKPYERSSVENFSVADKMHVESDNLEKPTQPNLNMGKDSTIKEDQRANDRDPFQQNETDSNTNRQEIRDIVDSQNVPKPEIPKPASMNLSVDAVYHVRSRVLSSPQRDTSILSTQVEDSCTDTKEITDVTTAKAKLVCDGQTLQEQPDVNIFNSRSEPSGKTSKRRIISLLSNSSLKNRTIQTNYIVRSALRAHLRQASFQTKVKYIFSLPTKKKSFFL